MGFTCKLAKSAIVPKLGDVSASANITLSATQSICDCPALSNTWYNVASPTTDNYTLLVVSKLVTLIYLTSSLSICTAET